MARLLVIGYGNPLRGDDGLGWRAAEDLAREFPNDDVEIRTCHQLLPEQVDLVSRVETTFFIDAAQDGEPGEVKCAPVTPQRETSSSSHQLSPAAIPAWFRELYGRHPRAFALSICGGCFEMGEKTLSGRGRQPATPEGLGKTDGPPAFAILHAGACPIGQVTGGPVTWPKAVPVAGFRNLVGRQTPAIILRSHVAAGSTVLLRRGDVARTSPGSP
jgi:hydrogenase maturation protease